MHPPPGWPEKRNQVYTAVIARYIRRTRKDYHLTDSAAIETELGSRGTVTTNFPPPDLVIAGSSNLVLPSVLHEHGKNSIQSPFMISDGGSLASIRADGLAFGVGLCHLLWAMDYIALGTLPWTAIMQDALNLPAPKSG